MTHLRKLLLAALILSGPQLVPGSTLTDSFNTNVNYLVDGIPGTIWDGVYFGAGEFANTGTGGGGAGSTAQCDANLTAPNTLTLQTTGTAWEGVDDDGFYLFKVVQGSFSARVHVVSPYNNASYNTAGLQARAYSSGGNAFGGSEDYVSLTRFNQFGYNNYLRNEVNGVVTQIDTDTAAHNGSRVVPSNSNYWLRIDWDSVTTTFSFFESDNGATWWPITNSPTLTRADFTGQPLQIGIMHATFNNLIGVQFTDFSITATNFDSFATPPPPVTGLSIATNGASSASISWVPDAASSGSVAVISSGAGPIKQMPANGFSYSGNAIYGLGDRLLATNYVVVFSGAATNVTVTNLPAGTTFNVAVYGFAGAGPAITYSRNPAVGSFSTLAPFLPPATNIVVDPVGPTLTNYTGLGEWNVDGNFDGWSTGSVATASVSGGVFNGTAGGTSPILARLNFAGGPDLDLGYNDQVELRAQVPADFTGDIQIYYGVTNTPGISASRILTIPNATIPKDGAFHVYRLDVGLEVFWRGNLRDLQLRPLGVAATMGQAFAVDYLRVGDLAGETYLPRYTTSNPAPGVNNELGRPVIEMQSKHFRFLWDAAVATNSSWRDYMPHGTLRNLEECWQVYTKVLGYREPAESWNPANRNGNKYKVNMSTWHSGYWAGGEVPGSASVGRLNITPDGLRVDPPTIVVPHELMHVFQMHQKLTGSQTLEGMWWEGHANYGRERWMIHFRNVVAASDQSGLDAEYVKSGHLMLGHGRDYYLTWPFFVYLDENPDNLPDLGEGTVAHVWQTNNSGVYFYNTLAQQTGITPLKDIVGYFARRELTFDYRNQTAMNNVLNSQTPVAWKRFQVTGLLQRPDAPSWWRVPMTIAPMQGAYATHELVPEGVGPGRVVTVNFHGLPDAARGADWRASFVAISDTGVERYTPLWNSGSNSITLAADENRLYLAVAGTPNSFVFTGHDDLTYPYRSHSSKQRLHYELQVFGAAPREGTNSTAGLVQHPNGGGWKASTATVASTAFLGPNARIYNTAQVLGNARIEDFAVVSNSAVVADSAVVSGHALIRNSGQVRQNARVRDWAIVSGSALITSNGHALEYAQVTAGTVTGFGVAKGSSILQGGTVGGWGIVDGDFMASRDVTNGVAFGHLPFSGVPNNWVRALPNRLYAQYEFNSANDSMVRDETGVTDAYLLGAPAWNSFLAGRSGVLSFNGSNQAVALDRSLSDWGEISVTAWVRWLGGVSNQPAWFFGSATNKCLFLTPDDGAGHARFFIRNGGAEQTLLAPAALASGVWTHVTVTLSNRAMGRLYVNGVLQQQGGVTIAPDQLNAPNAATGAQHNYLARGADASQPFFLGALDGVRVYTRALSNAEIAALGPANLAPTLAAISNRVAGVGVTMYVTNSAGDPDLPWQTLSYSLLAAPAGGVIDTNTGVFSWRPPVARAGTTNNFVQVRVADNGAPNLSATQNFFITVNPVSAPVVSQVSLTNGQLTFRITGDQGPDYSIQTSTNLTDWSVLFTTNSPSLPFDWTDANLAQMPMLFYRVVLGP